jgi:hypothetical protein
MGRSRPIALSVFDADRTPPREQNTVAWALDTIAN